jgi:RHS repeat-associated protein
MQIGLGMTRTESGKLQLDYDYGTTSNNGNVQSQMISLPGLVLHQTYSYDELNRLKTAQEEGGAAWQQIYSYDRFGNRNFTTGTTIPDVNDKTANPAINQNNNQLDNTVAGQTSVRYDAVGNLTRGIDGHTFAYDSENRMIGYDGGASSNGGATYIYDGDGRRVKKQVGLTTTIFVYNMMGQLVAEYTDSNPSSTGGTSYLTSDNLGTPRIITDAGGNVRTRHDYFPFGEEIGAGVGGRTAGQGYSQIDNVRQHFSGKERDMETGLDYFNTRYYSSMQGRFTSVDAYDINLERQSIDNKKKAEAIFSEYITEPRQWNRYTYAINNPLKYLDPTGEAVELTGDAAARKKQLEEAQASVGPVAGAYLYENAVKQPDGSVRYFIGIYTNGPNGNGPAFESINEAAGELGPIIDNPRIASVHLVPLGGTVTNGNTTYKFGNEIFEHNGVTLVFDDGRIEVYILDPRTASPKDILPDQMEDNQPGHVYSGELFGHEIGHARAEMFREPDSIAAALRIENKVRKVHDPNAKIRKKEKSDY